MNDIALKKLYKAGWTPEKKVDIMPIEQVQHLLEYYSFIDDNKSQLVWPFS